MNLDKEKMIEEEKEKLQARNFRKFGLDLNVFVTIVTAISVLGFVIFTILKPNLSADFFGEINGFLNQNFSWLFIGTVNAALAFLIYLGFSRYGKIRLGGYQAKAAFSDFSWYAMMFSAGVGIGLFFYGVAEPIEFLNLPEALNSGSIYDNFKVTYMHLGFHAWAI